MKKNYLFLLSLLSFGIFILFTRKITWHEPKFVEGVCVPDSTNIFHRLPIAMKDKVRKPVWDLSQNTAGEFIHFKTSATANQCTIYIGK